MQNDERVIIMNQNKEERQVEVTEQILNDFIELIQAVSEEEVLRKKIRNCGFGICGKNYAQLTVSAIPLFHALCVKLKLTPVIETDVVGGDKTASATVYTQDVKVTVFANEKMDRDISEVIALAEYYNVVVNLNEEG